MPHASPLYTVQAVLLEPAAGRRIPSWDTEARLWQKLHAEPLGSMSSCLSSVLAGEQPSRNLALKQCHTGLSRQRLLGHAVDWLLQRLTLYGLLLKLRTSHTSQKGWGHVYWLLFRLLVPLLTQCSQ